MEKENLMTDEDFVMTGEELAELCGLGNLYRKGKEQQLEEETKKIINEMKRKIENDEFVDLNYLMENNNN
jgi:hypothetical protein